MASNLIDGLLVIRSSAKLEAIMLGNVYLSLITDYLLLFAV